jgi:ketosteroid isomerase-like protein
MKIRFLPFF